MLDPVHRLAVKLVATAVVLVLTAVVWSAGTWSAFDRTSSSPGNSVATGSVNLTDNDGGAALLSLSNATSGSSVTGCIKISYSGSVPAHVRFYGTTGGTGLASNLTLTVTRGTIPGTPAARSCTGFTADATSYTGAGAGVLYSGPLSGFPSTTGTALVDPAAGAAATWSAGDAHAYRLQVTMADAAGAGKNAIADFTWLASST